jgi:CHASE2 domain-containing sensor protein
VRRSPYQGLVPYSIEDVAWFFGREQWTKIVIDNLRAYRVSVLYGASGVGKSSLLQAGVIPRLNADARRVLEEPAQPDVVAAFSDWSTADPAAALKECVAQAVAATVPGLSVGPSDGRLAEVLTALAERIGGVVFVLLDQLEDLFLYHARDEAGRAFEEELAAVIRRRRAPANVLLSIREDALAKLDRLHTKVPTLLDNLIRVDHLDQAAANEAIERPLDRWNELTAATDSPVRIEPELVAETLRQVQAGKLVIGEGTGAGRRDANPAGSLIEAPYLQLVLTRLWDEERAVGSTVLRLDTLERLGGADQIVRTHLDSAMAVLPRRERDVAGRVFRQLVTPSGTKIAHRPGDLAEYANVSEEVTDRLLHTLSGDARILRPLPDGAYEIYHDALAGPILAWRQRYEATWRGRRRILRRAAFLALSATVGALLVLSYFSDSFASVERKAVDVRFAIRGAVAPDSRVSLVAIDDATFGELGVSWPFPRALHAQVIDRLRRDGAKVIAYDVQFTEPTDAKNDNALIDAVRRAGNVVLATTEVDQGGRTNILGGNPKAFRFRAGNALLLPDGDQVIRHVTYTIDGLETFSLAAARSADSRPSLRGNEAWIDYAGPSGTYPAMSFAKVLRGQFASGTFRGKLVVVGPTAPVLQDLHETPTTTSAELMPGAEIQANAVATALEGFPLESLGGAGNTLLIIVLSLVAPLTALRLRLGVTCALVLALAVAYVALAQLAFQYGLMLPVSYPLIVLAISAIGSLFVDVGIPREFRRRAAAPHRRRILPWRRRAPG